MSGVSTLALFSLRRIQFWRGRLANNIDIVSLCMFMFGLVMIFQGLVSNWGGLMATRFFLGVFETGMFPGCKCNRETNSSV